MSTRARTAAPPGFPRFFRIAGYRVNSYKLFLCLGIYVAILSAAAVGERSGIAPLALGAGLLVMAIVGLIGARLYYLAADHRRRRWTLTAQRPDEGGWSVLGGLVTVPVSLSFGSMFGVPPGVFWDHMAVAIATGGAVIRFGCICNGCCIGRDSDAWCALPQHDLEGVRRRRIPVQWLEIGWWLLACGGLVWLWPMRLPAGSYGLLVLGWYGLGRVWLQPLRRDSAVLRGIRIDRAVAACLAIASAVLLWRGL